MRLLTLSRDALVLSDAESDALVDAESDALMLIVESLALTDVESDALTDAESDVDESMRLLMLSQMQYLLMHLLMLNQMRFVSSQYLFDALCEFAVLVDALVSSQYLLTLSRSHLLMLSQMHAESLALTGCFVSSQ
jgi:hypothetical protein